LYYFQSKYTKNKYQKIGKHYVIGGYDDWRQISLVDGCQLTRLELDLPLLMDFPICSQFDGGNSAMFCGTRYGLLDCWIFNGSEVAPVNSPEFNHADGAMTQLQEDPILIGGYGFEVELFDGLDKIRGGYLPGSNNTKKLKSRDFWVYFSHFSPKVHQIFVAKNFVILIEIWTILDF